MGKSALDFDDIQAVENRRREVAVLAGASPRTTKYEDSEPKQMIQEYIEERKPKVAEKFAEYQKEKAFPGYNWMAGTEDDAKQAKAIREEQRKLEDLVAEANKNEFKITDTSTGRPKPEPKLTDDQKEEREEREKREKEQREKERKQDEEREKNLPKPPSTPQKPSTQPSPTGSGDARSASGVKS